MNHRIAIIFASAEGQAKKIADFIADHLRERDHRVDVYAGKRLPREFDPTAYDGVIVGASVHMGTFPGFIKKVIHRHLDALQAMPSGFYSVSLTETEDDEGRRDEVRKLINRFLLDLGWQPTVIASFGGAVPFSRYGFIKKLIMRSIMLRRLGEVDISKDYEYTDWASVDEFGDQFVDHLDVMKKAAGSGRPQAR